MAGLRIELRLEPDKDGLEELRNWPDMPMYPDFAVAASGSVQVEIGGEVIGAREGKIALSKAGETSPGLNPWLPDYLGGFALNLGKAALKIKEGKQQSRARFLDEPLALAFRRESGAVIRVSFEAEGASVRSIELAETEVYRIIREALLNFRQQLLKLNPRLSTQTDLKELAEQIQILGEAI